MNDNIYNRVYKTLVKNSNMSKYYYFMWRNGLFNTITDFSDITEEQFIVKYCKGKKRKYNCLKMWESSNDYQQLQSEVLEYKINEDINKVYTVVRDKALEGDEKSIKTLLLLKKELKATKKVVQPKQEEPEEEFDLD